MGGPDRTATPGSLIEELDQLVSKDDSPAEIWPDMEPAIDLFAAMLTQWNVGSGGVVGLKYEVLTMMMDAQGVPQFSRRNLIMDLQIMEHAAIESMRHGQ